MSASLHTNTGKANIEVYDLPDCEANVVKIEDEQFNQMVMFMSLVQMEELANKLLAYVAYKEEF